MEAENRVIIDWAGRVAEIYRRLLQIDEERASLIRELEAIRTGTPLSSVVGIGPAPKGEGSSFPVAPEMAGSTVGVVNIPSGGTAKKVHEFMKDHPGVTYTPGDVTQALGLGPEGKPMVNTALSRLRRAGVLRQPKAGEYVLPEIENPHLQEVEEKEPEPNSIFS